MALNIGEKKDVVKEISEISIKSKKKLKKKEQTDMKIEKDKYEQEYINKQNKLGVLKSYKKFLKDISNTKWFLTKQELIKSIQELTAEIEKLKKENQELSERLKAIEKALLK